MNIEQIKKLVQDNQYVYSQHADIERKVEGLTFVQIEEALLSGEVLEEYSDTGRGESCLIVGFAEKIPVHVVCGWRGELVAIITVYIPALPKFIDPWTRARTTGEGENDEENTM